MSRRARMARGCSRWSSPGRARGETEPVIYETHLRAAEESAWPLESGIAWESIDREVASQERDIHAALHDAALVEGYLPLYAARLMPLVWDDVDATAVLSLELYEGLRHYTALRR